MANDGPSKSSLGALLSGHDIPTASLSTSTSSEPSPNVPVINESSSPPDGSLAPNEEVEYLSRVVFLVTRNAPQPAWFADHVSPAFRADFDNFPPSQTWEQLAETFRNIHRTSPEYRSEIVNIVVDVSEHNTHADAAMLIQTIGFPENVRRYNTARLRWRRRDGRWQVYYIWGVRAPFATFENI